MDVEKYCTQTKELYDLFLAFIETSSDSFVDFQNLINFIQIENIDLNQEVFEHFILLIMNVSNWHSRNPDFLQKIEQILLHYKDTIKQTFSNLKIFDIFKNNKLILLFLFENSIIKFDETIYKSMKMIDQINDGYLNFFLPEIKSFVNESKIKKIESKIVQMNPENLVNFGIKRRLGENDSFICSLIRNDSINEFISFVTKTNFSLHKSINHSIFETNPFLIEQDDTKIIEYAAFYGSINIFNYLRMNNVQLTPSLWIYAIHSNSADLIYILEEMHVDFPNDSYEECLLEAIKCHHNEIVIYFENNFLNSNPKLKENAVECCFKYNNYLHFSEDFIQNSAFFYLCKYNYSSLVNLYFDSKGKEIEEEIIKKSIVFFIKLMNIIVFMEFEIMRF